MLCFASAAFSAPPESVQLTYDVYKGSIKIGVIDESYTRNKDNYSLSSTTSAIGLLALFKPGKIIISSTGKATPGGLKPLLFKDQREREERRNRSAEFDWEAKQLTLIQQTLRTVVPLPVGTQDRLSAMYQFMFLSLKNATVLDFPMTNGGKLDNYHYLIAHSQPLATPAGEFTTLYLDNQPKSGENRTEIWLATKLHNLPIKMVITDTEGDQLSQVLSKYDIK